MGAASFAACRFAELAAELAVAEVVVALLGVVVAVVVAVAVAALDWVVAACRYPTRRHFAHHEFRRLGYGYHSCYQRP